MVQHAREVGADTFAFYTRGIRKYGSFALTNEDAIVLGEQLRKAPMGPLVVHAAYSMNLSYPDATIRARAVDYFRREMRFLEALPPAYYNFHAGRHNGDGAEKAIEHIATALNDILEEDFSTMVLLETLPGKGSEVGGSFEELAAILDHLHRPEKVGICLDTCHLWDGGYNIAEDPEKVMEELDYFIGVEKVKAIHLNDSFYDCGAHMDRHERVGKGTIGEEALRYFVQHPALRDCPFILETPGDAESHKREIAMIRSWLPENTASPKA